MVYCTCARKIVFNYDVIIVLPEFASVKILSYFCDKRNPLPHDFQTVHLGHHEPDRLSVVNAHCAHILQQSLTLTLTLKITLTTLKL